MEHIGIIGAGSWGTTIAHHMASKGLKVDLWVREDETYEQIKTQGVNENFLPGVTLSKGIRPVKSLEEAVREKELAVFVVPSHALRKIMVEASGALQKHVPVLLCTKGIERETLMTMSKVAESVLHREGRGIACLSGPSFAREVCMKQPTAVTIASEQEELATYLQKLISAEYFRAYTSRDLIGVELGGALKNVIAIAAGCSDGLGFGHNARAALITRGLAEITRLGVSMGANALTFAGLAGIGDLVLTCTGALSRNRTVGMEIAKGLTAKEITGGMNMVAEGVNTSMSAYRLSKKMKTEMPITEEVHGIIYKGKDPRKTVKDLMTRELKVELENPFA